MLPASGTSPQRAGGSPGALGAGVVSGLLISPLNVLPCSSPARGFKVASCSSIRGDKAGMEQSQLACWSPGWVCQAGSESQASLPCTLPFPWDKLSSSGSQGNHRSFGGSLQPWSPHWHHSGHRKLHVHSHRLQQHSVLEISFFSPMTCRAAFWFGGQWGSIPLVSGSYFSSSSVTQSCSQRGSGEIMWQRTSSPLASARSALCSFPSSFFSPAKLS